MASITITVTDDKVPLVMAAVGIYNAEHGTTLTVQEWVKRIIAQDIYRDRIANAERNRLLAAEAAARAAVITDTAAILADL